MGCEVMNKRTLNYAFLASLPVMAGYIVLGIGFGILLHSKGYSFWWSVLMSLTIYAGSMQYVGVDLLAGGASLISAGLMTLMVNARHLFYGISMVEKYRDTGKWKPYLIFSLTDETYSLVCDPDLPRDVNRKTYYILVSLFDQCYWVIGSLAGALIGSALTFDTAGIDFSMTALFVVIFVEQWEKTKQHIPALLGLSISLICLLIFGPDQFLIPSMLAIPVGLFLLKSKIVQGDEKMEHADGTVERNERNGSQEDIHSTIKDDRRPYRMINGMIDVKTSLLLIAVMALVTQLLRFLPFVLFSKDTPKPILYLGEVLPAAIMAMLVVYCLRSTDIFSAAHGIPEAIAVLAVVLLHKWKHSTLLSILGGTVCYMLLLHV